MAKKLSKNRIYVDHYDGSTLPYTKERFGPVYFLDSENEEDLEESRRASVTEEIEQFRGTVKKQFPPDTILSDLKYDYETFNYNQVILTEDINTLLRTKLHGDMVLKALMDNDFHIKTQNHLNFLLFIVFSVQRGIFLKLKPSTNHPYRCMHYLCAECDEELFTSEMSHDGELDPQTETEMEADNDIIRKISHDSLEHLCEFDSIETKTLSNIEVTIREPWKKKQRTDQFYEVFSFFKLQSSPDDYLFREYALHKQNQSFLLRSGLPYFLYIIEKYGDILHLSTNRRSSLVEQTGKDCLRFFIAIRFKEVTTTYIDEFVLNSTLSADDVLNNKIIKGRVEQMITKLQAGGLLDKENNYGLTENELAGGFDALLNRVVSFLR